MSLRFNCGSREDAHICMRAHGSQTTQDINKILQASAYGGSED